MKAASEKKQRKITDDIREKMWYANNNHVRKKRDKRMSMVQSVIMGLIQGLTEFLPVSSSGHLALFKILFNVNTDTGLLFDIMLHVGTLLAVCIVTKISFIW